MKKTKTCRYCSAVFQPRNSMQVACSPRCALKHATLEREEKERKARAETQAGLARVLAEKGMAKASKNAQDAVNEFIRVRDAELPCISCGSTQRRVTAGHQIGVGANRSLRYNTKNINGQCAFCNQGHVRKFHDTEGIREQYREGVRERFGQHRLDWIDGPHPIKQYRQDDLNRIRRIFKKRAKLYRRLKGRG